VNATRNGVACCAAGALVAFDAAAGGGLAAAGVGAAGVERLRARLREPA
jgi:hypothetical protein